MLYKYEYYNTILSFSRRQKKLLYKIVYDIIYNNL